MTFSRFYVGSKYPYFISYRGKWVYLFYRRFTSCKCWNFIFWISAKILGHKLSKMAIVWLRHSLLDFAAFTQDSRLPTCQSGDSIILLLFLRLARLFLKAASPVSSANKYRQCQGYILIDWLWHHFGLRPRIYLVNKATFRKFDIS